MRNGLGVLALALVLAGCGSAQGSVDGGAGYIAGDGSTILVATEKRGDVVELSGTALDGSTINTSTWLGDIVVVNLWASWCGPCRAEAVTLEKVAKELTPQGVHFLGLNTRDGVAAARAFEKRFPTGYPSIPDQDGTLILRFGDLGPAATPTTVILDRQGRVAARILGPVTEAQLRDVVTAVLQEN